jgi:hypothetical protein
MSVELCAVNENKNYRILTLKDCVMRVSVCFMYVSLLKNA